MNVYVKCFEIPDRLRASLNPDECEVLEVDGVPFIAEYGVFSPLYGLRIDPSGRYLLFCAFTAGLPYAPHDAAPDDDSLGAAAQQFRSTIKSIDPRAAEGNTMWNEVSWDIANGDWQ